MNELYFLGMDIIEEVKTLSDFTTITCTNGMTDSELKAYQMGVANTLSALAATIRENDLPVIDMSGLEVATELSLDEVENYYVNLY